MQPMAGQDLLHTQPRPMHWLATAAAISAVVAAASFIQPPDATATTARDATGRHPVSAPDPSKVTFPVDCGPNRLDVVKKASGDLDGDGTAETVAVVRCHSGMGSPPSGVYVLAQPSERRAAPRIVATLLAPAQQRSVQTLTIKDGAISGRSWVTPRATSRAAARTCARASSGNGRAGSSSRANSPLP